MRRELLILRHGKSDWSRSSGDFERPVNRRGAREAGRIGRWLREEGQVPDRIISSPARRARETTETACESMGVPARTIQWEDSLYLAGLEALLAAIRAVPGQTGRVMLVGHNPGLESLLIYLAGGTVPVPEDRKLLPTATVAGLSVKDGWRRVDKGSCEVLFIQRGRGL